MRDMAVPVSFRWGEEFVARVDLARGDVPRSLFVRRCVERALGDRPSSAVPADAGEGAGSSPALGPKVLGSSEGERSAVSAGPPAEHIVEQPREPKPSGCALHPGAGAMREQGTWWCAEPGCTRYASDA